MFVGVKFCGGCSPRYDRGEQVRRLAQKLQAHVELVSHDDPRAAYVLVVTGCKNACAATELLPEKRLLWAREEDEFDEVIKILRTIAEGAQ